MGLFGANMADFQLGLALDDKAGGYLETDEEIAQDDDPRACSVLHTPRQTRSWVVNSDAIPEKRAAQARRHQGGVDYGRRGHQGLHGHEVQ